MYCPSCGKEIPDNSAFCLLCGKPTNVTPAKTKKTPTEWVYCYHVISWEPGEGGKYYITPSNNEQMIRLNQWSRDQAHILPATQELIDKGWQPLTEIGPSGYIFRNRSSYLEFAAFRVKFRQPKPESFAPKTQKVFGKWEITDIKARGIKNLAVGLAGALGKLPKEMEFMSDYNFVMGKTTGLYYVYNNNDTIEINSHEILNDTIYSITYDIKWNGNNALELHAKNRAVMITDIYLQRKN